MPTKKTKGTKKRVAKTRAKKSAAKTTSTLARRNIATPRPPKPAFSPDEIRASVAGATSGSVVRERVIEIFANVCGKKTSEVDGPKLSELTPRCDVPFRAQIASAVNAEFNDLLQPYGSDNISCSATVSTLSMQIIRDQA